jgi:hypothetical protein
VLADPALWLVEMASFCVHTLHRKSTRNYCAKFSEGLRLLQVVQLGKKLLILLNACCRFLRRPVGRVCDTFCTDM